jgi:hypothetical protein
VRRTSQAWPDIATLKDSSMRSNFDTNEYVKGLMVAGLARAHAQGKRAEDAATVADLERLKVQLDAAAARAEAELKRFRLLTCLGILMLCATILLLHFSRT